VTGPLSPAARFFIGGTEPRVLVATAPVIVAAIPGAVRIRRPVIAGSSRSPGVIGLVDAVARP
jgi:hypothetical protein